MNYTIRPATVDDINQLIELRIVFLKEVHMKITKEDEITYKEHLEKFLNEHLIDGTFIAWIAVDDTQKIIATSGLEIQSKIPQLWNLPGKESYVLNMYTKPEWRRKGIGSALMEKLLEESKKRGITIISLHATPIGRTLYEKFGFKPNPHYMNLILE